MNIFFSFFFFCIFVHLLIIRNNLFLYILYECKVIVSSLIIGAWIIIYFSSFKSYIIELLFIVYGIIDRAKTGFSISPVILQLFSFLSSFPLFFVVLCWNTCLILVYVFQYLAIGGWLVGFFYSFSSVFFRRPLLK